MPGAPDPAEIFQRAAEEGERRLDQSLLELVSTGFIAGFTIVFGIVAQGITHAAVEPQFGEVARIAGALAFGIGLVFLVVGRASSDGRGWVRRITTVEMYSDPRVITSSRSSIRDIRRAAERNGSYSSRTDHRRRRLRKGTKSSK